MATTHHKVFNIVEERRKSDPVVQTAEDLEEAYGLEQAHTFEPGEHLIHVVRHQTNMKAYKGNTVRATTYDCVVVKLLPRYVRVRFSNGKEKNVRPHLLFKRKTA